MYLGGDRRLVRLNERVGIYDPWSGYLQSGVAVAAMAEIAAAKGVQLREQVAVLCSLRRTRGVSYLRRGFSAETGRAMAQWFLRWEDPNSAVREGGCCETTKLWQLVGR